MLDSFYERNHLKSQTKYQCRITLTQIRYHWRKTTTQIRYHSRRLDPDIIGKEQE
jgi:hypothetical protein